MKTKNKFLMVTFLLTLSPMLVYFGSNNSMVILASTNSTSAPRGIVPYNAQIGNGGTAASEEIEPYGPTSNMFYTAFQTKNFVYTACNMAPCDGIPKLEGIVVSNIRAVNVGNQRGNLGALDEFVFQSTISTEPTENNVEPFWYFDETNQVVRNGVSRYALDKVDIIFSAYDAVGNRLNLKDLSWEMINLSWKLMYQDNNYIVDWDGTDYPLFEYTDINDLNEGSGSLPEEDKKLLEKVIENLAKILIKNVPYSSYLKAIKSWYSIFSNRLQLNFTHTGKMTYVGTNGRDAKLTIDLKQFPFTGQIPIDVLSLNFGLKMSKPGVSGPFKLVFDVQPRFHRIEKLLQVDGGMFYWRKSWATAQSSNEFKTSQILENDFVFMAAGDTMTWSRAESSVGGIVDVKPLTPDKAFETVLGLVDQWFVMNSIQDAVITLRPIRSNNYEFSKWVTYGPDGVEYDIDYDMEGISFDSYSKTLTIGDWTTNPPLDSSINVIYTFKAVFKEIPNAMNPSGYSSITEDSSKTWSFKAGTSITTGIEFKISWGDGSSYLYFTGNSNTWYGKSHTYYTPGTYTIVVVARNPGGEWGDAGALSVSVAQYVPPPPPPRTCTGWYCLEP